jgi:hypothetical protein
MSSRNSDAIASALAATLESVNEADSNSEPANVVDGLFAIAKAIDRLALVLDPLRTEARQEQRAVRKFLDWE